MGPLEHVLKIKTKHFTDPADRQEAYLAFCEGIKKGHSVESFRFSKGDRRVTGPRILEWVVENPNEFDAALFQEAHAHAHEEWEGVVNESAKGNNPDANTASLQMKMRNRFGWDKKEREEEGKKIDLVINKVVYRALPSNDPQEIEIQENT
jgi:hypothetical protein